MKTLWRIIFLLCFVAVLNSYCKASERDSITLSGIVLDADHSSPLGDVNLLKDKKTIGVSDANGYFEIQALSGDTIVFSHLGFKMAKMIVPLSLRRNEYYTSVPLSRNSILLKEVEILPWPKENLKQAIMDAPGTDKETQNAQRNVTIANYQALNTPNSTWTREQMQKLYLENFSLEISDLDRKNAMQAGIATPATFTVLNTNALIRLILMARAIKSDQFRPATYQDLKDAHPEIEKKEK